MLKIAFTFLALVLTASCSGNLDYSVSSFLGSSNSILNTSEGSITASSPFVPNVEVEGEEYESVLWTKHSGPGDIIFSDPTILNPQISATEPGFYEAKLTVYYADGSSIFEIVPFEWVETDIHPPSVFAISSPSSGAITTTTPTFSWSEATDESQVSYTLKIKDSSCTTTIAEENAGSVLSYTLKTVLSETTNYCAEIVASDEGGLKREASNSPLAFTTSTTHTVEAGPNLLANARTQITGASSEGMTLTLNWSSTPGVSFSNPDSSVINPEVEVTGPDGLYTLTLTSTDSYSSTTLTDTTLLTWDTTAPTFTTALGPDGVTYGAEFQLTATPVDATSGIASGVWQQVSGSGTVVFSDPTNPQTDIKVEPSTATDTYVIKYVVTDNIGLRLKMILVLYGILQP